MLVGLGQNQAKSMLTIDKWKQNLPRTWAQVTVVALVQLVSLNDVAGHILHTSSASPSPQGHLCVDSPVVHDYGICYVHII